MDAYYMLMDWTGIPNLQKKAFDWLGSSLFGRLWPGREDAPPPTAREKRIFALYGASSAVVSFLFILLPFYHLAVLWMENRHFTIWGLMSFVVIALIIVRLLFHAHAMLNDVRRREYKIS